MLWLALSLYFYNTVLSKCIGDDRRVGDFCYFERSEPLLDWPSAEDFCNSYGGGSEYVWGHLGTFENEAQEADAKLGMQINTGKYWMGYHRIFEFIDMDQFWTVEGAVVQLNDPSTWKNIHRAYDEEVREFFAKNATCFYADFDQGGFWIPGPCVSDDGSVNKGFICRYPDPEKNNIVVPPRPSSWDYVTHYEVSYYYRRAYCNFKDGGETLCPAYMKECFGIKYTDARVCQYRGECTGHDRCDCNEKYNGPNCDFPNCYGDFGIYACSGRGICNEADECLCNPLKYNGDKCEHTFCNGVESQSEDVCNSKGSCVDFQICECKNKFHGRWCEIVECDGVFSNETNVCNQNGFCNPNTLSCECDKYYFNDRCQSTTCYGVVDTMQAPNVPQVGVQYVCNSHGKCVGHDKCECDQNWAGTMCEFPLCNGIPSISPDVCSSRGDCVYNSETTKNVCVCDIGYGGVYCESPACFGRGGSQVCSGHGECTESVGENERKIFSCACNTGYSGDECDVWKCFGVSSIDERVCSGNGICIDFDKCSCSPTHATIFEDDPILESAEWGGIDCSIRKCYGFYSTSREVCSGSGSCLSDHTCLCNTVLWKLLFFLFTEGKECEQSLLQNFFSIHFPWTFKTFCVFIAVTIISFAMLLCRIRWMTSLRKDNFVSARGMLFDLKFDLRRFVGFDNSFPDPEMYSAALAELSDLSDDEERDGESEEESLFENSSKKKRKEKKRKRRKRRKKEHSEEEEVLSE